MNGYQAAFTGSANKVDIPDYSYYTGSVALNKDTGSALLPYIYYSVVQHKQRRLPLLSASNIYRTSFTVVARSGNFKKDKRLGDNEQLSAADYSHFNTIKKAAIEKGHMTKREDVHWDELKNEKKSYAAARSTFYYPNAVPQHDALNNGTWKLLENSIIIKGRVLMPAKVCVFTGPVLDPGDPFILSGLADGAAFQVPVLFWKVVYYIKPDKKLYAAGFLMGQLNPLKRDNIISLSSKRDLQSAKEASSLKPFLEFEEDEKYQVPVRLIEQLTHLRFQPATDLHKNKKPIKLVLQQVQTREFGRSSFPIVQLIENINV